MIYPNLLFGVERLSQRFTADAALLDYTVGTVNALSFKFHY